MIPEIKLIALEAEAATWAYPPTPFCEFSAKKGIGVCCHALPLEIYFGAAWLPRFAYPMAAPRAAHVAKVESFLALCPHFELRERRLPAGAGDTLHFRLGRTSHFMLCLSVAPEKYIHAVHGGGVQYAVCLQPSWRKRLHAVYRPIIAS